MEEIMRKMQNMGKTQFMEETRKTRSAWVEEAVKRCSPYAPDGIRKELLQAAAIFCYGTLQTINMAKRAGLTLNIICLDDNPVFYIDSDSDSRPI